MGEMVLALFFRIFSVLEFRVSMGNVGWGLVDRGGQPRMSTAPEHPTEAAVCICSRTFLCVWAERRTAALRKFGDSVRDTTNLRQGEACFVLHT